VNKQFYIQMVALIGKLIDTYGIDPSDKRFDYSERAVLEQAVHEWRFYAPPKPTPVVQAGPVGKSAGKAERV
jgi:hypothetical protein